MARTRVSKREEAALLEAELLDSPSRPSRILRVIRSSRFAPVPISRVKPNPRQPRQEFNEDDLLELAGSIRRNHLQQPIVVHEEDEEGEEFILIMGERRLRAFQWLAQQSPSPGFDPRDFEMIPAEIRHLEGENRHRRLAVLALIENLVRRDLSVGERAAAFTDLRRETGWSWEEIAEEFGLPLNSVRKYAVLHDQQAVLDALDRQEINVRQALIVGQVRDDDLAAHLVARIRGLSDEETVALVRASRAVVKQFPGLSARDAVRKASEHRCRRAAPAPGPMGFWEAEIDGEVVREPTVRPALVPLDAAHRRAEVRRDEYLQLLQETCALLDLWPERPGA